MIRKQTIIPLAVGLVVGGAALTLSYRYLMKIKNANTATIVSTKAVVIASHDLPMATTLTEKDMTIAKFPPQSVPSGACSDPKQLMGKSLRMSVVRNMPLVDTMIGPVNGFGGVIPDGYLAVAVKVDEYTGVAGFLQPGDRVAVVGTFKIREGNKEETVAKIILPNVEVRAIGQQFREEGGEAGANLVRSVTLLVKPEEAERLHLGMTSSKIHLAMRAPMDSKELPTVGVTLTGLLGRQKQPIGSETGSFAKGFLNALELYGKLSPPTFVPSAKNPSAEPYMVELVHADKVEKIYFESSSSDRRVEPGAAIVNASERKGSATDVVSKGIHQ